MPALVSDATGATAMGPEQVNPATQGDDSLAALAMFAVLGNGVDETGHSAVLQGFAQNGIFRFGSEENTARPNAGRYHNTCFGRELQRLGDTGFEPVTSAV